MHSNASLGLSPTPRSRTVYDDALEVLRRPVSVQSARRARFAAGMFAVAGSAAVVFGWGTAADAKTAQPSAAPAKTAAVHYTVQKGDTLSGVAAQYGISAQALAAANNMTVKQPIIAGKTITIPAGSKPGSTGGYKIKRGETLSSIASKHGITANELAAANGIKTTTLLNEGRSLVIPAATAKVAKAAVAQPSTKNAAPRAVPTEVSPGTDRFGLKAEFRKSASKHGVPVSLLQAVAWNESGWQNDVVSNVGARGIGQIMPGTAKHISEQLSDRPLDPGNPADNIEMSAIYLKYLVTQTHGDYKLALAAYYQGLASVREKGQYSDTKQYVRTILALEKNYFS